MKVSMSALMSFIWPHQSRVRTSPAVPEMLLCFKQETTTSQKPDSSLLLT